MRKTLLLPCLHFFAAILAAVLLCSALTGCATTNSDKPDPARDAYVAKRTKYYLAEGGLSDENMATTAAVADWESGKSMEDSDKRLGLGAYKLQGSEKDFR